jgi:small subunit ribosomal protein S5
MAEAEKAQTTTPRAEGAAPAAANSRPRGGRRDDRRNGPRVEEPKQFEEVVINIDRVARVVKGGRRFRFKALVVVGDRKAKLGVGVSKGGDVQTAVAKATDVAKKNMITIPIANETIPHDSEVRFSGAQVLIKPAAPGTGVIAGGVVRQVIGVTGIRNMLSKSLGSTNKVNIAYATIEALKTLVPKDEWLNAPKAKKAPAKKSEVVKEEA